MERDIEKNLVDKVKQIGGLCYKFTSPGNKGVPDRIVIYKGAIHFVELKNGSKGRLSKSQKIMMERFQKHGIVVSVISSKLEVDKFIIMMRGESGGV